MSDPNTSETSRLERLINNTIGYVETRIKLIQLEAKNEMANVISQVLIAVLITLVISFTLFLLIVALALYIGSLLGNNALGFLIIGSVFLVFSIVLITGFQKVKARVQEAVRNSLGQVVAAEETEANNSASTTDKKVTTVESKLKEVEQIATQIKEVEKALEQQEERKRD